MKKQWWTYLLSAVLMVPAQAQNAVHVTSDLGSDSILIGEQTEFTITVSGPGSLLEEVAFPTIGDTISAHIEVVKKDRIRDTLRHNSEIAISQRWYITSWDSGYFAIPPYPVKWKNDSFLTEALLLYSTTVPVDTTLSIKDIKDIFVLGYTWTEWWWKTGIWIVLAIGLAGVGFLFYFRWKKRPKKETVPAPVPTLPLHQATLQKLEKLQEKRLWETGQVKTYYVELSDILRQYIEHRFEVSALEQTSSELLQSLRFVKMEEPAREKLYSVLLLADLVKFAKEKPMPTENKRSMLLAGEFVRQTRELHQPETPTPPAHV